MLLFPKTHIEMRERAGLAIPAKFQQFLQRHEAPLKTVTGLAMSPLLTN